MRHINQHTCSKAVDFEVENGIVTQCEFIGGCSGNTQGVAALVVGRPVEEVIQILSGIDCGGRGTSCPDQFAKGLQEYLSKKSSMEA
ncbi:MAG: TIGR03905 family TSCPD domain-containing protein [Clostridia bacterium]|nr:TIGR03905 family TSCPD domain-containing protein [Lachnospiraceae bacterium]NCB99632.1 TIGR03905 family TSCPD domain-containing protein [Clostridia bacterium]NCD01836.1 TIGR03905 family TSCPD domain-containing protein [Clostridia bacterium]